MKRGGANNAGSTSSVAHTVGCNELRASASTSEVSELDDASRKNAAMLAAECVTVSLSLSLSLSLSDTSAGMASVVTKTGDDAEGGGHALGAIVAVGDGVTGAGRTVCAAACVALVGLGQKAGSSSESELSLSEINAGMSAGTWRAGAHLKNARYASVEPGVLLVGFGGPGFGSTSPSRNKDGAGTSSSQYGMS
jgi:hypothetical protein